LGKGSAARVTGELPTVRSAILAHCKVAALCLGCDHI
jgi:hypothetical protein